MNQSNTDGRRLLIAMRRPISVLVSLLAVGLLYPMLHAAVGQPRGSLTGRVVSATGAVYPGATVMVHQADGSTTARQTGGGGRFEFTGLTPGTYSLTFALPGYPTEWLNDVPIRDGPTVLGDMVLWDCFRSRQFDEPLDAVVEDAAAVVHLKILDTTPVLSGWNLNTGCHVVREHRAEILETVKFATAESRGAPTTIRFGQTSDGPPYPPGTEYVALLARDPEAPGRFRPVGGVRTVVPVVDNRVGLPGLDPTPSAGQTSGLLVTTLLANLRTVWPRADEASSANQRRDQPN